jgi:4-hydroxybenzoate polyprenyltransferase
MANCKNHPDVPTELICTSCGRAFCRECLTDIGERKYCKDCLKETVGRKEEPAEIKSPVLAAGLSFLPGLGHIYNGLYKRAIVLIIIFAGLIHSMTHGVESVFVPLLLVAFWAFVVADAYRCAKRINERGEMEPEVDIFFGINGEKAHGSLFWGILLIVLGVMLQLHNLGLSPDWLFRLWPLLVVFAGFYIIFRAYEERKERTSEGEHEKE